MPNYPLGRWSVGEKTLGASVWTQKVPEGGGGGYYLYRWERGADRITLAELAEGTTSDDRRAGHQSKYVTLATITVPEPEPVRSLGEGGREIWVARIMYVDMRQRFGKIAQWIPYDTFGKPVWFHEEVTGEN